MCCFTQCLISMSVCSLHLSAVTTTARTFAYENWVFLYKIIHNLMTLIEKHILGNYIVTQKIFQPKLSNLSTAPLPWPASPHVPMMCKLKSFWESTMECLFSDCDEAIITLHLKIFIIYVILFHDVSNNLIDKHASWHYVSCHQRDDSGIGTLLVLE